MNQTVGQKLSTMDDLINKALSVERKPKVLRCLFCENLRFSDKVSLEVHYREEHFEHYSQEDYNRSIIKKHLDL